MAGAFIWEVSPCKVPHHKKIFSCRKAAYMDQKRRLRQTKIDALSKQTNFFERVACNVVNNFAEMLSLKTCGNIIQKPFTYVASCCEQVCLHWRSLRSDDDDDDFLKLKSIF